MVNDNFDIDVTFLEIRHSCISRSYYGFASLGSSGVQADKVECTFANQFRAIHIFGFTFLQLIAGLFPCDVQEYYDHLRYISLRFASS